jgi:hypothetical protein
MAARRSSYVVVVQHGGSGLSQTPTLYDWMGGAEALNRLTGTFYRKVLEDPVA